MTSLRFLVVPVVALALVAPGAAGAAEAVIPRDVVVEDAAATPWLEGYQTSRQGPEQTERVTRTFTVERGGALDLSNIAGDVRVTARPGNAIRIEAIKRVRHRDAAEARRQLEALRVDMTSVAGRVEVRTQYPRMTGRGLSASVDFTITVPPAASVSVKTISGSIAVEGVQGEVRAESVSGDVDVAATPNLVVGKTVSGSVRARDISTRALTLSAVSGDIVASGLKVRTLDAGTVSGNLRLSGIESERVQAKSVSGDIQFEAALERGGRYEFNSHSGSVRIVLVEDIGFELDASTFSGSIRSDFPVTLREMGGDGRRPTRTIRGTYGDAGAILAVRSFSGSVVISRK